MSNSTLSHFHEGVPPPDWTRRARAEDELRAAARGLYHGCLRIDVRRSGGLYRKIEGWAAAAMSGPVLSARSA
jgi:hypothetical protein